MTSEVRQPISVLGAVPPEGDSTGRHLIRGSTWMIAWRWSVRAIGFISTLILARLLTPNDFGIIAMAMVVVGLLETISLAGPSTTLIRIRYLTR